MASLRLGGLMSLIAPNPAGGVLARAVREMDPAGACDLLDASTVRTQTFETDVRRLEPEGVAGLLAAAGCPVESRYGIRVAIDLVSDEARKRDSDFYAELERLELAVCDRPAFVGAAHSWQLVGRRV